MDNDDLFAICALIFLFTSPFLLVLTITLLIAYTRTRTWQIAMSKANVDSPSTLESHPLRSRNTPQSPADADSDFESDVDSQSEDEGEAAEKTKEIQEEYGMTARQKFRKEFVKCWTGSGARALREQKEKEEREERRKVVREVVREVARLERRRARKARSERKIVDGEVGGSGPGASSVGAGVGEESDGLPSYGNAVGLDRKN